MNEFGDRMQGYEQQAHAMSHPTMQAEGVQHVSDAAWVDLIASWLAEARADRDALSAELAARADAWESIEFGLREENRKLRCEIDRLRKERDETHEHATLQAPSQSQRTDPDAPLVRTVGVSACAALMMLPETDARFGRGNAAMDAHE